MTITLKRMPAGICDNCSRACCTLDQAGTMEEPGIECYHCGAGRFRHRALWVFSECGACANGDPFCAFCRGRGVVATPRE